MTYTSQVRCAIFKEHFGLFLLWCVDFVFQVCLARFLSKALLLIDSFDYSRNNCWTLGGSFFVSVSAKTAFSLTMFFTSNI